MCCETLNRDAVESVVIQGADPRCSQPEEGFLKLRREVEEGVADCIAVCDPSAETCW